MRSLNEGDVDARPPSFPQWIGPRCMMAQDGEKDVRLLLWQTFLALTDRAWDAGEILIIEYSPPSKVCNTCQLDLVDRLQGSVVGGLED